MPSCHHLIAAPDFVPLVAGAVPIADAAAAGTASDAFLIGGRRNGHAVTDIRKLSTR